MRKTGRATGVPNRLCRREEIPHPPRDFLSPPPHRRKKGQILEPDRSRANRTGHLDVLIIQALISHLTNSNGCGNLQPKVPLTVSPFPPSFSPRPSLFSESSSTNCHSTLLTFAPPLFSCTCELPLPDDRFACPVLSDSYELLFPQILSFDNHLRCPGVWGYEFPSELSMQAFKSLNSIIHILLRTLCRRQKTQLLCNQASPNSFS